MRKAEEIKKALAAPVPVHYHVGDPEPRLTPLTMCDLEELKADALALIQQLEAERDSAVADIRLAFNSYVGTCRTCKHGENQVDCIEPIRCENCENEKCKCQSCDGYDSNWEWRGVQKEIDHNAD